MTNKATDVYVDYRGYRLRAPFICMCCGKETSPEQFAYGRTCGVCDTGICQSGARGHDPAYAHELPPFFSRIGTPIEQAMAKYAEHVNAEKLPEAWQARGDTPRRAEKR